MFAVGHFDSLAGAIAATDDALELGAVGDRADRPHDPRPVALQARVPRAVRDAGGRPRGAAVRHVLRRHAATRRARKLDRLEAAWQAPRPRLPHAARRDRRRAGRAHQGAQVGPRAADGGQHRRAPPARVRRGHRGRARAPQRLRRPLPRGARPPRPAAPASTATAPSAACTSARSSTSPRRAASRRCAPSPRRSSTLVAEFDGVNSCEHGDGRVRSAFNRRIFGDDLYEAMRKVKALFDPDGPAEPRRDGRRARRSPRTCATRRCRRRARSQTRLAFPDGDARRRRPLPAHRRLPQDRQRRHVPVLHGHARGGARHARARQRARQGALLAGPEGRAGRRAPARDPRPLPGVQGVQERVPAQRRHGDA